MTKRSNVSAIAAQLLCGILFQINYARAEKPPSPQVVGFAGTCDELTVAGTAEECVGKLSYMNLRNGTVVLSIETKKGYMVSFVGEKDSQPRPEEYHLYISRVRMFTKATESVASAAGQCVVSMSRDGTIWSEIKCQATDADRASYDMTFRPDKKPIFSNLEREFPLA